MSCQWSKPVCGSTLHPIAPPIEFNLGHPLRAIKDANGPRQKPRRRRHRRELHQSRAASRIAQEAARCKWGFAPLSPQTIIDGHIMNAGAVTEALGKIFQDSKIQQREVAVGVYGQSVIVRKITVPMMTQAELDEQIQWEAEHTSRSTSS